MFKRDSVQLLASVLAAVALVVLMGLVAALAPNALEAMRGPAPTPTVGGLVVDKDTPARDFTLTDQNGQPLKLSDLRGRAVLLFFGYTHCPDICPLSMGEFKTVKKALGDRAEDVAFVMISLDPARDTPEVLKRYVEAFDPAFIGLTGDENAVRSASADYGVQYEQQKPPGTAATYLIAHTAFSYLLDQEGRWRRTYPFQTPAEMVARDIVRILDGR